MKYREIKRFTREGNYQVNISLDYLQEYIEEQMDRKHGIACLDIDPDFHRGHVWNDDQRISYTEFFLRGGYTGRIIYTNCVGWQGSYDGPYVLVDGKQRLTALMKFVKNEFPVFGDTFYKDLGRISITDCSLLWNVNNLETRKEVLQWYLDLNTGGVVHTEFELNKVKKEG
jgi:hypothetical protein